MKKLISVVLIGIVLTFHVRAQNSVVIDSLTRAWKTEVDPCRKAEACNELSRLYISESLKKASEFVLQGIEIARDKKCERNLGNLYNTAAIVRINEGNNIKAFAYIDSSLEVHRRIGNKEGLAAALGNKGTLKIYVGKYDDALKLQFECLKINEELNNKSGIATTLVNIFTVYFAQKDYPKSLEIALKAYSMFKELNEVDGMALMSYNIASVYFDTNNLDSCSYYIEQSKRQFEQINNKEGVADSYRIQSDVLRKKKKFDEAISLIEQAIETYNAIGQVHKRIESYSYLASVYYDAENYQKSIQAADTFLKLSQEFKIKQFERDAAQFLMKNYKAMKQFEKAMFYSDLYQKLKDEILNEESISEINRLKNDYENEKKESELQDAKQKSQLLAYDLERKNIVLLVLLGGLILISAIVFLVYNQRKIKSQRQMVMLEQRLLRAQMNPHFIFNSLTAIQTFVYKSEPKEAGKFLSSFAALIRTILDNSREEYISLNKEINWLENYLKLQLLRFENRFSYTIEIDESVVDNTILIPPMLTQPFIENALEHGLRDVDYHGEVAVQFKQIKNMLYVTITDNGVGLNEKLNEKKEGHISHATEITKERLNILNRSKSSAIVFNLTSLPDKGTMVEFSIPINS